MANRTNISWSDATWNPVTGCSKISTGCANCYAATLAPRLAKMGAKGYTELPWTAANSGANVTLHPERLLQPLTMSAAGKYVFTCSMSDLFHDRVPDDFLDQVFAVMALAPQHTFQILTKRPQRMSSWVSRRRRRGALTECLAQLYIENPEVATRYPLNREAATEAAKRGWPLPNVWLGTSVEDQRAADERIPHLLDTPAKLRFLSCEPLIGSVDLRAVRCADGAMTQPGVHFDPGQPMGTFDSLMVEDGISWVIAGGESGPNYRVMDPQWARELREDCRKTGTAFFFKQHSARHPEADTHLDGEVIRQFPGEDS